jgi:fatty acid desaturase
MDTGSELTASRNTSSRIYNFISWNLGYHTAHHIKSYVHWSRLPEFHAKISHAIPEDMKCNSVLLSACSYRHSEQLINVGRRGPKVLLAHRGRAFRWRPAQEHQSS